MRAGSADRRFCGPRLFAGNRAHRIVGYRRVVSKLRRPFLSEIFLHHRAPAPTPYELTEVDFTLLARAFHRARALHSFYLTAWVFLPDYWHCISAPQYPATISRVIKAAWLTSGYEPNAMAVKAA